MHRRTGMMRWAALSAVIVAAAAAGEENSMAERDGLVGLWTFDGDGRDHSGNGNHGRAFAVDFGAAGRSGHPSTAAHFNGVDACIEVRSNDSLRFGTGAFTITAWVRMEEDLSDVVGDVVSKFDSLSRKGFNLYVKASSPTYNAPGDAKHLHFGIDNNMDGPWEDCGKPWPSNTYISSLTAYKRHLYVGIADALGDGQDACHVFRYGGGQQWIDCGRVGDSLKTRSAYSLIVHRGDLYCGTGRYDWQTVTHENCDYVRVYRYKGGTQWEDCGQPGRNYRILGLCSFKGDLYAATDDNQPELKEGAGEVFRYLGGTEWENCGRLGNKIRSFCVMPHNGRLYGANDGEVYVYEGGAQWTYVGNPFRNVQIHCLQVYRGQLIAGTWPRGHVARYDGGMQWTDMGTTGITEGENAHRINEVNDLTVYNGKLYAGLLPRGEVFRYEEGTRWTMVRRLLANPDWDVEDAAKWARVPSLTEFEGRLYAGTAACRGFAEEHPHGEAGRVYSMQAGQAVSFDDDVGSGWKHIAAVRDEGMLRLYVDGEQVAASREPFSPASYDISNDEPLYIGFGAVDYFSGDMDELRIYRRALGPEEVRGLARE